MLPVVSHFIDHTKGKFDLRNFFTGALTRARKGSTIGNKFGYLWMGAIPFNQNAWFKFSATSMQYLMEQHFRNIYPNFRKLSSGSFLSAFNFAPECLKFLIEWFAFRKFSGSLGTFPKFLKFWANGKRPKCIQEILVLRESSARTTMCKKVCCTSKLDLLTLALLITSPGQLAARSHLRRCLARLIRLGADHLTLEGGWGVILKKKSPASACRKKNIACSSNVIENLWEKREKNILPSRLQEKKILDDQKSILPLKS